MTPCKDCDQARRDIAAILGPGDPAVLVGNLVIERDRLLLLLEAALDLPCYAARGEDTYECRVDSLCPACALRALADETDDISTPPGTPRGR